MKAEEVRRRAFAMPLHSPAYPPGPYRYIGREYLSVRYRTDPSALARIVPAPLEVLAPEARIDFIRMPDSTGFGEYCGAAQVIRVRLGEEVGDYTRLMFLDAHAPIAGGRELWGFPHKLAAPALGVAHDTLVGTLDFGSIRIATGSMGFKHRTLTEAAATAALHEPGFLLKVVPHVDATPRICELVRYRKSKLVFKGAWTGPGALQLEPHALAPLSDLPVLEVLGCFHAIFDMTLELGTVVHDYLA